MYRWILCIDLQTLLKPSMISHSPQRLKNIKVTIARQILFTRGLLADLRNCKITLVGKNTTPEQTCWSHDPLQKEHMKHIVMSLNWTFLFEGIILCNSF